VDGVPDGQSLDLVPAGLFPRCRMEGRLAAEPVRAQPVDPAGVGSAEVPRVLRGQKGLAYTAQVSNLDHGVAILVGPNPHRGQAGVDTPELVQPADEARGAEERIVWIAWG